MSHPFPFLFPCAKQIMQRACMAELFYLAPRGIVGERLKVRPGNPISVQHE